MVICLAKVFSDRKRNIRKFSEFMMLAVYMAIPTGLVVIQPDFGTAMVYIFTFCVLIFVSGTDARLLLSLLGSLVLLAIPVWYAMNNTSADESFRLTRFLIWLDPESYPDEARQVINAQIAVGSGGLFGKGVVSPGSFASLGYISDDHTDFIFAIVCESFGMAGGFALVGGYILLIGRLIWLAVHTEDAYGSHIIMGVLGVLLFHIIENLCMVIGLLPVTGIPLPFVSYGGSNMMTNMAAIGLVENVVVRSRKQSQVRLTSSSRSYNL
jgi:rod shape determining protein RodA